LGGGCRFVWGDAGKMNAFNADNVQSKPAINQLATKRFEYFPREE